MSTHDTPAIIKGYSKMRQVYNGILALIFFSVSTLQGQEALSNAQDSAAATESDLAFVPVKSIDGNGFKFETFPTGINSENADYGIGFFRNKFLSFSARKIGILPKKDPATNEPYTKLYCADITQDWNLRRPLLFSYTLNSYDNLSTLAFSQDGNTLFFTRSSPENTQIFQLYSAIMNPEREGEFIDFQPAPFNSTEYSIENPTLSRDGKTLYFASNSPEALGGYDIFKVAVAKDRTYGSVERVEGNVNTVLDEKFPQIGLDNKYLYFSSKGHDNIGGFDLFRSRKAGENNYVSTRNLGNTINTPQDEVAYIPATKKIGYLTSNREGGEGGYDIYKLTEYLVDQQVKGIAVDAETGLPLSGVNVILLDNNGTEVTSTRSKKDGSYSFPVDAFLKYTLLANKEGFERSSTSFETNTNLKESFDTKLELVAEAAPIIETSEKVMLQIDNIQFDTNSAKIKDVSTITLNKVARTLNENPMLTVAINAHTDKKGTESYNLQLSDRRAASAMRYLQDKGIAKDRMISKGFGESQPLIDCTDCTPQQLEENRRIEFVIRQEE